ncbi:hypothetical protein [Halorubrum salipaludis]|nr:hypothetical protein [Halorubrum salipaludis]
MDAVTLAEDAVDLDRAVDDPRVELPVVLVRGRDLDAEFAPTLATASA